MGLVLTASVRPLGLAMCSRAFEGIVCFFNIRRLATKRVIAPTSENAVCGPPSMRARLSTLEVGGVN